MSLSSCFSMRGRRPKPPLLRVVIPLFFGALKEQNPGRRVRGARDVEVGLVVEIDVDRPIAGHELTVVRGKNLLRPTS